DSYAFINLWTARLAQLRLGRRSRALPEGWADTVRAGCERARLDAAANQQPDFWSTAVVGDCDILLALLAGRMSATDQASATEAYRAAFARGGSAREHASVIDHLDFLIDLGLLRAGLEKVRNALSTNGSSGTKEQQ
ncbi:MAG TPA: hypothetical protein VIO81_04570, partial [Methyloversatilis sp.]